jgi:hypothetical protein
VIPWTICPQAFLTVARSDVTRVTTRLCQGGLPMILNDQTSPGPNLLSRSGLVGSTLSNRAILTLRDWLFELHKHRETSTN